MEENLILEELGFNRHESKLYLILLDIGESSAVVLSKESGLHRRTVYDVMESLKKKGLVNIKIKKHVKHFAPTNPEALKDLLEEKHVLVDKLLPGLLRKFGSMGKHAEVSIYEGVDGLKAILNDIAKGSAKGSDEVVMLGAGLRTPNYMKYSFPHYVKMLEKMKWRLIEPDVSRVRKDMKKWDVSMNSKNCRFLPAKYLSPVSITVYGDRTLILLLEGEPIIIQIIGDTYARAFRNYFELLWRAAK